uniref:Putative RRP12-like protein isoform X1 n=1 Tax=Davidia involucrata TaxID=16924 RepID=A0A5B6YH98_DAVIN
MKKPGRTTTDSMEEQKQEHEEHEITETTFTDPSDICQQLLDRYAKSSAPQHRHLCATAAATRSIIQSESLPLTPLSYFAATIATIAETSKTLDSNAVSALSAFLSIVLPLVPEKAIVLSKVVDAVSVLVELVESPSEAVSTASVRAVVKCLGVLVGFGDLEDWDSVKLGFETLLKFSIDRRPKVRKCAQDCLVKVFKSFKSSAVIKEASKLVFSLLKGYMPLAVKISASGAADGSKDEVLPKAEQLEVLHLLNVLKLIVPYLSVKVSLKVLSQLHKLMSSQFSALTRHIFNIIEAIFETSRAEVIIPETDNIIKSLASYVNLGKKNPMDTVLSAATLLKSALDKLHAGELSTWISNLPLVFGSIAGLLNFGASTASQASIILKELINHHFDRRNFSTVDNLPVENEIKSSMESSAIKSTCAVYDNMLSTCAGIPNEYILAVISVLFLKLGEISYFYMKGIILKLADLMTLACRDKFDTKSLQECIGSAIIAVGPEKTLALLPISLSSEDFSCSNIWLIPILKKYVTGSSLGFFMEHIVPLAESFQRACRKVKKSAIGKDLQAHARGCFGLLPAFCRHPTDTHQNFEPLAKLLITFLTKDSFMLETIATALQELVNQNRSVLGSNHGAGEFAKLPKTPEIKDSAIECESKPSYSKKIASRNIKALASCSEELLQTLTDVFFSSAPEKRTYLKDAIGCLASITDSSVTRQIFISSLERFQLMNDVGEYGKLGSHTNASVDKEQGNSTSAETDANRSQVMELASSLVEGANEDFVGLIFNFIRHTLQETDEIGQHEAYRTLSRILEEHSWFCSSQFIELIDLLLGLKSPVDNTSLRSRFACFQILLVHAIKRNLDEENTKAFLILNEIILTIKDSKEETRKAAYDILLGINSSLQNSSAATSDGAYHKLISMLMGYLSGSSPQIKSGAVSALSVLVYNNTDICLLIPDLVPSVVALLQTKAVEVIKAALGFMKVLVSCLQAKDLQNFLSDIVNGVLPWSFVSRNHFRSKVTVILEIMVRKCGSAAVELLTPEKYKNFVKSVLESRHGKTSSKGPGTTDVEPKLSDSSPRRQQKRKRQESDLLPEEDGSVEPRKRKQEKNHKGIFPSTNEPHVSAGSGHGVKRPRYSNHDKLTEDQSRGSARNRRNFNRDPSGSSKRKMEGSKVSKRSEMGVRRPATAPKLSKHRKASRKQQKISK